MKNNVAKIDNNIINEMHKITSELFLKSSHNTDFIDNKISSEKELELEELKRFTEDPRERLRTSLSNCSAWILANNLNENEKDQYSEIIDFQKPQPPSLSINQLPKITNQQAEMFSNILQKSATTIPTTTNLSIKNSFLTSKVPNISPVKNEYPDEHQNKRIKLSQSEERLVEANKSLDKIRQRNSIPPLKDNHMSSKKKKKIQNFKIFLNNQFL